MIGYEATYISRADISDDNAKTFLEKVKGIITAHGGETLLVEDWGRRRLSYPINKETRGLYTHLVFTGNNSLVAELERNLRIAEPVMRFLTVKLGDDFDKATYKHGATPANPHIGHPPAEQMH